MREILRLPAGIFVVFGTVFVSAALWDGLVRSTGPNALGSAAEYTFVVVTAGPGLLMIALGLIILRLAAISDRLRQLAKQQGRSA